MDAIETLNAGLSLGIGIGFVLGALCAAIVGRLRS